MVSVTANSLMAYVLSREGALPFSRAWHKLNPATRTLANAVWLATCGAFISARRHDRRRTGAGDHDAVHAGRNPSFCVIASLRTVTGACCHMTYVGMRQRNCPEGDLDHDGMDDEGHTWRSVARW